MENLYVTIFNKIETAIREGNLIEDQKLSERKLAEEYKVSRTVIREALKVLSEKGLVTSIAGKGNYVTKTKLSSTLFLQTTLPRFPMHQIKFHSSLRILNR